jgi:hypothetical protein
LGTTPRWRLGEVNVQSAAQCTPSGLAGPTAGLDPVTSSNGMTVYGTLSDTFSALNRVAHGNIYRLRTGAPMSTTVVDSFIESLR